MATASASVCGAIVSAITPARGCHAGRPGGAGQPRRGDQQGGVDLVVVGLAALDGVGYSSFTVDFAHGHFGGGVVDDGLVGGIDGTTY